MKFIELSKAEFRAFLKTQPLNDFVQAPEMEEIGKQHNWKSYYVGVKVDDNIVAASRIMARKSHFGKQNFYAPRGLILDYHNKELLAFFTKELKKFIKQKHGYILTIDPALIYQERDIDGNIVEGGINNKDVVDTLISLGYHHLGFPVKMDVSSQVRFTFVLDLKDETEESIFANMKPNTRNLIRKTMKDGIEIRELEYDELERFKKITEATGERRNFSDRTLAYYQKMYQLFHPNDEVHFLLATLNLEKLTLQLEEQKKEEQEKLDLLIEQNSDSKKAKTQRRESEQLIQNLENKIKTYKKMMEEDGNVIDLSAAMFMTYGNEVVYLFSGNVAKYMKFNAQYLIQWHMIQYGLKHKFPRYNFYGISGIFDRKDPDYGVYEFKRGFNGHVEEYIGEFELPISNYYYIQKKLRRK